MLVTGDYKFDQTPVDGKPADVSRLAELGREGVLLLCGDSTNADRPGFSPSESGVGPHLEEVFARCEGRIVVTSFASNIHRVQQVVDAAAALDRKVALVGRSMRKNVNIGRSLGHIDVPDGMLLQPREVDDFPDHKLVVVSTGSQGEPLSALRRMAHHDHPQVKLHDGRHGRVLRHADPGQRAGGQRDDRPPLPDRLRRRHHARRADPRVRPRLRGGAEADAQPREAALRLARSTATTSGSTCTRISPRLSASRRAIFKGENGMPLEIDEKGARFGDRERAGMIFVDGVDIGDPSDVALRDRRMLSADGIFIVVATISEQDGESVADPEVILRGVPFLEEVDNLIDEIRDAVDDSLERAAKDDVREVDLLQQHLHDDLAEFVYDRLKRRPMVLPVVVEV